MAFHNPQNLPNWLDSEQLPKGTFIDPCLLFSDPHSLRLSQKHASFQGPICPISFLEVNAFHFPVFVLVEKE